MKIKINTYLTSLIIISLLAYVFSPIVWAEGETPSAVSLISAKAASGGPDINQSDYYNYLSPYFTFSASSHPSGIDKYWVYFGGDANASRSDSGNGPFENIHQSTSYQTSLPVNQSGLTLYLRVFAEAVDGNKSDPVTLFAYKFDAKAPINLPGKPTTGSELTADTTPTWNWTPAFDQESYLTKYQFLWVKQGSNQPSSIVDIFPASSGHIPTTFTIPDNQTLSSGVWFAGVIAFDAAGNKAESAIGCVRVGTTGDCSTTPTPTPTPTSSPTTPSPTTTNDNPGSTPSTPPGTSNPAPTNQSSGSTKIGDFNKDGKVDLADFNTLLLNWGKKNVSQDLNNDGTVDLKDFNQFLFKWNT